MDKEDYIPPSPEIIYSPIYENVNNPNETQKSCSLNCCCSVCELLTGCMEAVSISFICCIIGAQNTN